MILNMHLDASYLSESDACSHACSNFFMGWSPTDGDPIKLNGTYFTLCAILRFVVTSAAKAEPGALFLNCKEGIIFHLNLKDWATLNQKLMSIVITLRPSVLLQKHRQTAALGFNGNEIFLGV
jgi:hypothetical protein